MKKNANIPKCFRPYTVELVRLGGQADGGYLVPKSLMASCEKLLCFGINLDWKFETDYLRYNLDGVVQSFDRTTKLSYILYWSISRFLYSPVSRLKRHFLALAKIPSFLQFVSSRRVHHTAAFVGSKNGPHTVSVEDVLSKSGSLANTILKIDIEGNEYSIFESLLRRADEIAGFILEFHEVDSNPKFLDIMHALANTHYFIHLHVNNAGGIGANGMPRFLEVTTIRKDLAKDSARFEGDQYSHELDRANFCDLEDYTIKFI